MFYHRGFSALTLIGDIGSTTLKLCDVNLNFKQPNRVEIYINAKIREIALADDSERKKITDKTVRNLAIYFSLYKPLGVEITFFVSSNIRFVDLQP